MIEFSVMDILTTDELDRAGELYAETGREDFVRRCASEIITPVLARIDEETGEGNDPLEIADLVRRTFSYIMGPGGFVPGLQ